MPSKRKRNDLLDFDVNKSDSDDVDFDPTEWRQNSPPARRGASKSAAKAKAAPNRRKRGRYAGSDIDEDDDVLMDSEDNSFDEGRRADDDEDSDDAPVNPSTGRAMRKAATKAPTYKESSAEDSEAADSVEERPKPSRVVKLKVGKGKRAENPAPATVPSRRTRANTEDAELVELSNSGRHGVAARSSRGSRSRSPEAMQNARATRGSKGLKKPPSTIDEATQESGSHLPKADADEEEADPVPAEEDADELAEGDTADMLDADHEEEEEKAAVDEPEADAGVVGDDEDDEPVPALRGRATRQSRLRDRPKKSLQEPSSDFEPVEEDSAEGDMSGSDTKSKKQTAASQDEEYSSQHSRGRRAAKGKGRGKRRSRRESEDEEVVIDEDEIAQEIEDLRASSHSRSRRRRRRSPSIAYVEPTKRRRTAAPVSYAIKPLDQLLLENEEEEDPAPSPSRRKKGGGGSGWQRNLLTTFGPFGGGGGAGALIGGPWGTGATGGVDSDSSDDEAGQQRPGPGLNIGMTPTTATAPAGFAAPLNLEAVTGGAGGAAQSAALGKIKNTKALADADPLGVDLNVNFSQVGGLQGHIDQLKEMVSLPLLYPELFKQFNITPPRGVLFHGPPGTGKTLLARALANSMGVGGKKITFYMRKGADALSKWVGEAEKQLRLLFEDARKNQPSIIFFDEIDGLAPVRSSKQEQIHASIVSTLLALMDGMDGRGQVIVIGATNRPDNIDPALRRPGRFDREFYFPLPDLDARLAILNIHTKGWDMSDDFKRHLAKNSKGYGGADLRALCTEAAINAIQRTYPQIYTSTDKLVVDPDKIKISATDFTISMKKMVPSSERSSGSGALALPKSVEPLLRVQLEAMVKRLADIFPRKKKTTALEEALFEPYNDADHGFGREQMLQEFEKSLVFRPRLLITGVPGMGQQYLAAAILHHFEDVHVQTFDPAALVLDGQPLEQAIAQRFTEARRHKPSVLYVPNIDSWPYMMSPLAHATFKLMLNKSIATDSLLLLATADCETEKVDPQIIKDFFPFSMKNHMAIEHPNLDARMEFFTNVCSYVRKSPTEFPDAVQRKKRVLEDLPVAPPPPEKVKTKADIKAEKDRDLLQLNLLKVQLQPIMDQIKKYKKLRQSVITDAQIAYLYFEADPNFVRPDLAEGEVRPFEIGKDKNGIDCLVETATGKRFYNLDIATIEERLSNGYYARPKDFMFDVQTLAKDAKNIGDKERTLKANELITNVQVDVAELEARLQQIDFEALHQRQLQRAKETAEKEAKRAAAQKVVDSMQSLIRSDVQQDSDSGPVRTGEPLPGTTTARFRLMSPSPLSNGAAAKPTSNGVSEVPSSSDADIHMTGVDEEVTQPLSQMPPPSQWPRMEQRPSDLSARATAGNTQVPSQISAMTTVPDGVSPYDMPNDASTTKSTHSSGNRASGGWSTQATNGIHSGAGEDSQLLDTQPQGDAVPSQKSSSSDWAHSQAHGMAKGQLEPRLGFGGDASSDPPSLGSGKSAVGSLANVLNEEDSGPRLSGSSAASSQPPLIIAEANVDRLHQDLANRTSGCTVEQLEQINRELMAEIWKTRTEYNRSHVLTQITNAFNESIRDMEEMQSFGPASQEDDDKEE